METPGQLSKFHCARPQDRHPCPTETDRNRSKAGLSQCQMYCWASPLSRAKDACKKGIMLLAAGTVHYMRHGCCCQTKNTWFNDRIACWHTGQVFVFSLTTWLQAVHIAMCPQGTHTHDGLLSQQTTHRLSALDSACKFPTEGLSELALEQAVELVPAVQTGAVLIHSCKAAESSPLVMRASSGALTTASCSADCSVVSV